MNDKDKLKKFGAKYDWDALKIEFLRGKWINTKKFRESKELPQSRYMEKRMQGWVKEKIKLNKRVLENATDAIAKEGTETVQIAMKRQANMARWLQLKGAAALKDLDPKDADEARKLIVSGMKEERTALGAGKKRGGSQSLHQVNINLPKTRFDEMIDELGYEGLLGVIAEVKKLRTGKSGETIDAESQGEVS